MPDPSLDDIDSVFARAGWVEPPGDLFERVMAGARAGDVVSGRRTAWASPACAGAYLLAFMALAILAYELGVAIAGSGTTALASVLIGDASPLAEAPGAYLGALLSSLPWLHLAAVAIDVALVGIVTSLLLRGSAVSQRAREAGAAL